jgi:hypothetical protein
MGLFGPDPFINLFSPKAFFAKGFKKSCQITQCQLSNIFLRRRHAAKLSNIRNYRGKFGKALTSRGSAFDFSTAGIL